MDPTLPDYRLLHFWSDDIPADRRVGAWQEFLSRKLLKVEVTALSEEPLKVDASLRALSGLRFGISISGPSMSQRTREIVAADANDFYLMINLEGKLTVHLRDSE